MGLKSTFPWWALRFGCSSKGKPKDGEAGIDNMETTGHTLDTDAAKSSKGDVAGTARARAKVHDQNFRTPRLGILRLDYNYPAAVGDIGK